MDFECAYQRSSIALQNVSVSLEGLRIQSLRYEGGYKSIYRDVLDRTRWSRQDLDVYREARIRTFFRIAEHSPY